jgi:16S rRNA (guanine527-N7)-methyltransferase
MTKHVPNDAFRLLNAHCEVSYETFEKLSLYHDLLIKWQNAVNLVSNDSLTDSWNRHFLDSLQLLKYLDGEKGAIVDIGSGAGFPGMALAICGVKNIHLIESDSKKTTFLKEVSRITKTDIFIRNERVEKIKNLDPVNIILSRAFADLNTLLGCSSSLISQETKCLFHKGKNYSKELEDAKKSWSFDAIMFPSVTDENGVIVKLSNIHRRMP